MVTPYHRGLTLGDERQKPPVLTKSFYIGHTAIERGMIGRITSGNDTDTLPVGQMDEVNEHADSFLTETDPTMGV
jgi:hypothetical protein